MAKAIGGIVDLSPVEYPASAVWLTTAYAGRATQYSDRDTPMMARAALLLPVLWQARIGRLGSWWRLELADALDADCAALRAAAVDLLDAEPQPWETGGAEALDAWYIETRELTDRVVGHVVDELDPLLAAGSLDPDACARWELVLGVGHRAGVLADASFLAAGGDPAALRPAGWLLPGPQLQMTDADRAVIDAPRPQSWTGPPATGGEARLVAAWVAAAGCSLGGGR